jgi:hypothetical protein
MRSLSGLGLHGLLNVINIKCCVVTQLKEVDELVRIVVEQNR